jgi:hypothetical protein
MRRMAAATAILAAAIVLAAAEAPRAPERAAAPPVSPDAFDRMNLLRERPGCTSIPRQVAGEDRRYDGTRLDRQPPGQVLLAVDRQIDGCREAVLLRDELRRRRRR